MIVDFYDTTANQTIESDICVIGGGAAGITLALAFEASRVDCCILESGGKTFDDETQSLFEVVEVGAAGKTASCRLRYLGGATNHWGGYCAPLNPIDFESRPWILDSGWPLTLDSLVKFYIEAQKVCQLGPYKDYQLEYVSEQSWLYHEFLVEKIIPRVYQFSSPPLRFASAYYNKLAAAQHVTVYLRANVTSLNVNDDASVVESAQIQTTEGKTGRVKANVFILACGGIENARILLLSDQVEKTGLGNSTGNVGRYFMQHPHVSDTDLLLSDAEKIEQLFKKTKNARGTHQVSLGPSPTAQRKHQIGNCSATIHLRNEPGSGSAALGGLWRDIKRGRWPDDTGAKLWRVMTDIDSVVARAYQGPRRGFAWLRAEQTPNPESRIVLADRSDRLGQRLAKVVWRLSNEDKRTLRVSAHLIAEELGRLGLGRLRLPLWLLEDDAYWPDSLWGGCHHMGSTRMSTNAATGVVTSDCRVHSVANLYIAGSSVFPTGGYANPTLTIVALALRLAEHLGGCIRQPVNDAGVAS